MTDLFLKTADLKHRVVLASMKDVVTENGVMSLSREAVIEAWAKITETVNRSSFMGVSG